MPPSFAPVEDGAISSSELPPEPYSAAMQLGEQEAAVIAPCPSPSPRYGHSLALYGGPDNFILFGGTTYLKYFNDLWLLDTTRREFTRQDDAVGVPSARFGHTCHVVGDQCLFFGGSTNLEWYDDLYTVSRPKPKSSSCSTIIFKHLPREAGEAWPCARRSHTFAHYRGCRSVLYGGYCRVSLHDVWFLDISSSADDDDDDDDERKRRIRPSWSQLQTCGVDPTCSCSLCPDSRYCHSSVVAGDDMIVFGGYSSGGVTAPVLWRLDLLTGVWSSIVTTGQAPRARFGQTASLIGNRMVLLGGMSNFPHGESLSDCFVFNVDTKEWQEVASPLRPPKYAADDAAASAASANGGLDLESGPHHDGADSSAEDEIHHFFGRRSHAAAVDPYTHSVIIFGGWNSLNISDDYCFRVVVAPPTLRELVRNFIGVKMGNLS